MTINPFSWLAVGSLADSRRLRRQVAFVLALTIIVSAFVIQREQRVRITEKQAQTKSLVEGHLRSATHTINGALSATSALAALVRQGHGTVANFDAVAEEMIRIYPGIGALQLAPDGIVRFSVPLAGNEKAIGHNLLADPTRTKEAFLARDSGKLTLAGPFNMIQGGLGAVGRYPVFLSDDQGRSRFWGFTSVLIRFPDVVDAAGLKKLGEQGYRFVLWRTHPDSGKRQIIASSGTDPLLDPIELPFDVPNGQWTLGVEPVPGWGDPTSLFSEIGIAALLSLLLTAVAAMALRHPIILHFEEARRTRELAESEARFRDFFEKNSSAMLLVDPQTERIVAANDAAARFYGYASDQLIGMSSSEIGEQSSTTGVDAGQRMTGDGRGHFICKHRLATAEVRDVEIYTTPIASNGSTLLHSIVHDITSRRQVEQKLEDHRGQLEELVEQRTAELSTALAAARLADQTKDAFLANMSHELRTPLNAVIGMASLAQSISKDPRQRDYLEKVTASGKHLNRIINDLLDLSKISAGHIEFESTAFRLRALLDHATSVMAPRILEKNIRLVQVIDAAVPDVVIGDPSRIEQILLNLLGNAVKFTPSGRIELRAGLEALKQDQAQIVIEVMDTGIGLSSEEMTRLFKPFTQADASISRKFGGTGLGLAICKHLCEIMGGDISVSSQRGLGTTFRVKLALGVGTSADLPSPHVELQNTLPAQYRNTEVLVVEDQPLNREIVDALLNVVGIKPRMAFNGLEALDILSAAGPSAFDLILMDIQMPVMDGIAATQALRSRAGFETIPIVAMTAHTMAHEKEKTLNAGMNDHIGKPFDNTTFYRTLAKWIAKDKQIQTLPAQLPAARDEDGGSDPGRDLHALPGLDAPSALTRLGGREDRYRHWLKDFVDSADAIPARIRNELQAGDADAAARTIHAFKGRVGMLGMTELHALVTALETTVRHGKDAGEMLARLENAIKTMREQLVAVL